MPGLPPRPTGPLDPDSGRFGLVPYSPGMEEDRPVRVAPGNPRQIGIANTLITRVLGAATGGRPLNLFTTVARSRGLFRLWLLFAARLMPFGRLPRSDAELVILRVAHNTGCEYEFDHHTPLARKVGLSEDEIARVREGPAAEGWTPRARILLEATDALTGSDGIDDRLWARLAGLYDEPRLIEFCFLVGHYEMLAKAVAALGIERDREWSWQ